MGLPKINLESPSDPFIVGSMTPLFWRMTNHFKGPREQKDLRIMTLTDNDPNLFVGKPKQKYTKTLKHHELPGTGSCAGSRFAFAWVLFLSVAVQGRKDHTDTVAPFSGVRFQQKDASPVSPHPQDPSISQ